MSALLNVRDTELQAAPYRSNLTLVTITSSAGAFKTHKNGGATLPTSITLTAVPSNVYTAAAEYTWHYALGTSPTTWVLIGHGISISISAPNMLGIVGDATSIQYRCTTTETLLSTSYGFYTVSYSKEPSEPIVVDITRTNAVIPCSSVGAPLSYLNTDTVISVFRGDIALTYSNIGGINTFKVDIQVDNAARTLGAVTNTATTYTLSGITNIFLDVATVIFVVTVYDASGNAVSPTFGKKITYTKVTNGVVGADATYYYITSTSPIISKSTSSPSIIGTHSNITVTGTKVVGSINTPNYGYLTVTANGDTEAVLALSTITTAINNTAGKTDYTIRLYNQASVTGAVLLDTEVIPVIFAGSSAVAVALSNDAATIPTNSAGTAGIYTGTSTEIHVYEGTTELAYDGAGTLSGSWMVSSTFQSNITVGSITDSGVFASVGTASNIAGNTAYVTYYISGTTVGGIPFTRNKTQTFSKALAGIKGDTGTEGTKSITISAFKWGTSIGGFVQPATYTWGGTVDLYPPGWTPAAPASTANGQTLYQINLTITALASATTTGVNWSTAVTNTIGYRLDGSIGPQGNSARVAYIVTTSGTPPATPTPVVGDLAPTGWSFTATSVLTAGQYMYQSDGILSTSGNIAWGVPYLSNLKVGSLEAISANLGTVGISSVGSLASTGKGYATGTGFYMGYSSNAYKFDIGSTTNYLRWDGTTLIATGLSIRNSSGVEILSSGTVLSDIMNSSITPSITTAQGTANTAISNASTAQGTANTAISNASTAQGTANTAISNASTAISIANAKLAKGGVDILSGVISMDATTASGFRAGNLVWNSAGSWVSGSGVAMTAGGIVGYAGSSTPTFSISSSGSATFSGTLSAAQITTGTLGAGVLYAGTISATQINAESLLSWSALLGSVNTYNSEGITVWSGPGITAVPRVYLRGTGNNAINAFNGLDSQGMVAASGWDFYAAGTGINYGPFTGGHDAIITDESSVDIGDIVIDYACRSRKNVSNTLFEVAKSASIKQKNIIGVVAHKSGLLADSMLPSAFRTSEELSTSVGYTTKTGFPNTEFFIYKDTYDLISINAVGEGQINVCGENGNFEAGDFITTSSIPGKGMRQEDDLVHNYTVAKCREAVSFSSTTEVKMAACIYICG